MSSTPCLESWGVLCAGRVAQMSSTPCLESWGVLCAGRAAVRCPTPCLVCRASGREVPYTVSCVQGEWPWGALHRVLCAGRVAVRCPTPCLVCRASGREVPYSVLWCPTPSLVCRASGREVPYTVSRRRDGDCGTMVASCEKAKLELGWTATRTLQQMCESPVPDLVINIYYYLWY